MTTDPGVVARWWPPLRFGLTTAGVLFGLWYVALLGYGRPNDLDAYYAVDLDDVYAVPLSGTFGAFTYTPAFAQLFHPLTLLPFELVEVAWRVLLVLCVALLAGPLTLLVLLWSPVASDINVGNIHLLMAVVIAYGLRYPAAWSFILLTKITPAVGVVWFLVRGEWRSLAVALGATAAIAAVSIVLAPEAWLDWVGMLALNASTSAGEHPVPIPLYVSLPAAVGIVGWGALWSRPAVLPLGALLASPVIHFSSFALLLAVLPLLRQSVPAFTRRRFPSPVNGRPVLDALGHS